MLVLVRLPRRRSSSPRRSPSESLRSSGLLPCRVAGTANNGSRDTPALPSLRPFRRRSIPAVGQPPHAVADLTHRPAHPAKGAVDHRSLPFMVSGFVECSLPVKVGGDHDPVAVRGSAGNESCMNQPALLQSPSRESRLGSVRRKRNELRYYRVTEWGGLFREIPAMSDQDQGEYDLADVPEPRQPKAPVMPGQPLP